MLKGRLSIHRNGDGRVALVLTDELSLCQAVEVQISPADFAHALTGLGDRPCEFDLNTMGNVGLRAEVKRVRVHVPVGATSKAIREAVAAHEIDGWRGRDKDARNGNRRVPHDGEWTAGPRFEVTYDRFVHADGTPWEGAT